MVVHLASVQFGGTLPLIFIYADSHHVTGVRRDNACFEFIWQAQKYIEGYATMI